MRGVSEIVPLARQFPGIVQIAQALPISFIKALNPLMAKFSEFERVSPPIRFWIREIKPARSETKAERRADHNHFPARPPPSLRNFHALLCVQRRIRRW